MKVHVSLQNRVFFGGRVEGLQKDRDVWLGYLGKLKIGLH